jgi:hypothetical protein
MRYKGHRILEDGRKLHCLRAEKFPSEERSAPVDTTGRRRMGRNCKPPNRYAESLAAAHATAGKIPRGRPPAAPTPPREKRLRGRPRVDHTQLTPRVGLNETRKHSQNQTAAVPANLSTLLYTPSPLRLPAAVVKQVRAAQQRQLQQQEFDAMQQVTQQRQQEPEVEAQQEQVQQAVQEGMHPVPAAPPLPLPPPPQQQQQLQQGNSASDMVVDCLINHTDLDEQLVCKYLSIFGRLPDKTREIDGRVILSLAAGASVTRLQLFLEAAVGQH